MNSLKTAELSVSDETKYTLKHRRYLESTRRVNMRILNVGLGALLVISVLAGTHGSHAQGEISSVTLIDGARVVPMKDSAPNSRGRFGVPLSKQYFIFSGSRSALRTTNKSPVFEFVAVRGFDVESEVYLFRFDTRAESREIRVAKGSSGLAEMKIPTDHIIPAIVEDIGEGPSATRRYRLKPKAPLRTGEYCLAEGFTSYYDFGVD
jgi:hypothetical protein